LRQLVAIAATYRNAPSGRWADDEYRLAAPMLDSPSVRVRAEVVLSEAKRLPSMSSRYETAKGLDLVVATASRGRKGAITESRRIAVTR